MSQVARPERVVVGVDFGTLSGRAVVVRVADGAELGTAIHDYPHGVIDRALPDGTPLAARLGAAGRPRTTSTCCAIAVPAALAAGRRRPGRRSSASAPTSPPARWCRPSPTAPRSATLAESRRPTRTPTSSCGSTTPRSRQADRINALAARARRAVAGPLRRPDLLGVGVRQGPPAARGGARASTPRRSAGSRPPTGSSGSCAARYVAQRLHRRLQGHLPGRHATRAATSSPSSTPSFADFVADKLDQPIARLGDRVGRPDRARPPAWTGSAGGHRGRRRQRRRARDRARGAARSSPGRWSRSWAPRPATS